MRYYNFALYASAEQIKENTTINLREYAYENPIAAVNNYMYKRLDNDVAFLTYREEGNTIFAVFVYDEKKKTFADAFSHATNVLKEDFSVNRIKTAPYEITIYQALDFLLEAQRRDFSNITTRFIELSNLWIYNYYNNERISFHYNFEERIVSDKSSCANAIYDPTFIHELTNLIDRALQNQAVRLLPTGKDVNDLKKNELFKIIKDDISLLEEGLKDERKAGTAKTSVARLFAEILKDEKVLSTGTFVEAGRADLVGDHVGATAPLVKRKFKEAQGGILFIDEAINTLVQEMENHRDDVIVIFAGYTEPMQQFLDRNPGMLSRIAFQIEFEDYTTDELCDIAKLMASKKQMTITGAAMDKLRENFDIVRGEADYGNGRFVRKTLEEAEMNLAERVLQYKEYEITKELITTIEVCDIPDIAARKRVVKRIGFAS